MACACAARPQLYLCVKSAHSSLDEMTCALKVQVGRDVFLPGVEKGERDTAKSCCRPFPHPLPSCPVNMASGPQFVIDPSFDWDRFDELQRLQKESQAYLQRPSHTGYNRVLVGVMPFTAIDPATELPVHTATLYCYQLQRWCFPRDWATGLGDPPFCTAKFAAYGLKVADAFRLQNLGSGIARSTSLQLLKARTDSKPTDRFEIGTRRSVGIDAGVAAGVGSLEQLANAVIMYGPCPIVRDSKVLVTVPTKKDRGKRSSKKRATTKKAWSVGARINALDADKAETILGLVNPDLKYSAEAVQKEEAKVKALMVQFDEDGTISVADLCRQLLKMNLSHILDRSYNGWQSTLHSIVKEPGRGRKKEVAAAQQILLSMINCDDLVLETMPPYLVRDVRVQSFDTDRDLINLVDSLSISVSIGKVAKRYKFKGRRHRKNTDKPVKNRLLTVQRKLPTYGSVYAVGNQAGYGKNHMLPSHRRLTFKRRRFFKQRVPSDWFFQGRISKKKLKGGSKNCAQGRRDAQRAKARGAKADSVYDADVSRDPKIDELVRSKTSVETGMKVLFEMFGSQDWFS